jgi:hypothetical protein
MEPENRPYVDAKRKPGDDATEAWANTSPGAGDPGEDGPQIGTVEITDDGVVEGSPADEFINDPEAIDPSR